MESEDYKKVCTSTNMPGQGTEEQVANYKVQTGEEAQLMDFSSEEFLRGYLTQKMPSLLDQFSMNYGQYDEFSPENVIIEDLNFEKTFKNGHVDQEKLILKKVNLKDRMVKNVNIPKFLCKIFFKYLGQYGHFFSGDQAAFQFALEQARKIQEWSRASKNNYLSLKHLQMFFGNEGGMNSKLNRKVMQTIMRKHLTSDVTFNPQIRTKNSYLNTLKTYALRCMNSELSSRVQSK